MDFPEWLKLCQCNGTQICPFCQTLVMIVVALLSGLLGYGLGKRAKGKSSVSK